MQTISPLADPIAPSQGPMISLQETLENHYGVDGELCMFSRSQWLSSSAPAGPTFPYWEWVVASIDEDDNLDVPLSFHPSETSVTLPDGTESTWILEQNLTSRWGDFNEFMFEKKPGLAILQADPVLLGELHSEMRDEITFIGRKDGQFGVYFELEYVSIESEEGNTDEGEGNNHRPHAAVIAGLLENIAVLQAKYPKVEFCIPDASNICNDRPAIWAFVKLGALSEDELDCLSKSLLAI